MLNTLNYQNGKMRKPPVMSWGAMETHVLQEEVSLGL